MFASKLSVKTRVVVGVRKRDLHFIQPEKASSAPRIAPRNVDYRGPARPHSSSLLAMIWRRMRGYDAHAGVKDITLKLGVVGPDLILAGSSNASFADPCDVAVCDLEAMK